MNIISIYPHPMDDQYRHDQNVTMIKNNEIYSYEESKLRVQRVMRLSLFLLDQSLWVLKQLKINPKNIDFWVFPVPSKK